MGVRTVKVDAALDTIRRAENGDPSVGREELLGALEVLGAVRSEIEEAIDGAISAARSGDDGVKIPWHQLGSALGVSRQAVTGRHQRRVISGTVSGNSHVVSGAHVA